ncbi:MAG: hypothetical protein E7348_05850 [Clostridiales bacterium]|nr:hypothetical protein [Clostridiales bacterium]
MTSNNKQSTRMKHILALILAFMMCLSLIFAVACSEETTTETKIPEYSYSDTDESEISNPNFVYGTSGLSYTSFPKTTVTGWSISKDSSAKSGVIDVSEDGWKQLMTNLYADSGILNYIKNRYDFDNTDVTDAIKKLSGESDTVSSADIKNYIINHYFYVEDSEKPSDWDDSKHGFAFTNPETYEGSKDSTVYMLNNYKTNEEYGSIQRLTSSTEIALEKGQIAQISVWVKTANINADKTANSAYNKAIGANIRVQNSFAGETQEDFGIYNIISDEWKQYTFYVKADQVYDTKFTVVLGLGYDDYKAEGTVYFDDIEVKLLDSMPEGVTTTSYALSYNSEDGHKIDASSYNTNSLPLYDMSFDVSNIEDYTSSNTLAFDLSKADYTKFNNSTGNLNNKNGVAISSVTLENVPYAGINKGIKVDITSPSSYTINLDSANFEVGSEKYTAVSFFVKNQLNKLYATDISINVKDINGSIIEDRAVATISDVNDQWQKCTVLVKNNFEDTARKFAIEIVIGPSEPKDNIDEYALGTVQISNAFFATGASYQYDKVNEDQETANYDYYKLFSSTANGSTALYAGYVNDFTADEADETVYNLTVAPVDLGTITKEPAQPKNYTGIESGHFYITGDKDDNKDVNTNKDSGLINSQYLDAYTTKYSDIETALAFTKTEDNEHIQPLMIKTADKSYGFISNKYTVAASQTASVSVKVRVYADAKAYIYLVDVDHDEKQVMTFDTFTVNTDLGLENNNGDKIENRQFMLEVDSAMMGDDGWVTVNFYIATGANEKNFRLEVWNGERNGTIDKGGYVFVNDVTIKTSSAFTEVENYQNAINSQTSNPLSDFELEGSNELFAYVRELTEIEKQYNADKEKTGANVEYFAKYIWAKTDTMIYGVYNTIDPVIVDPYEKEVDEEETEEEETEVDPAAFWLSLSSIILGVVLLLAIIMLFIKNIRRRRKANASDAKSHFKVVSRTKKATNKKKAKANKVATPAKDEKVEDEVKEQTQEEVVEQTEEQPTENESAEEQTLDSYVYGDVQNFGETSEENKEDQE